MPTIGRGFDAPLGRLIKSSFPTTLRSSPMHQTRAPPRAHVRGKVRDGRCERNRVGRPPMGKEVAVNRSILIRRRIAATEKLDRSIVR